MVSRRPARAYYRGMADGGGRTFTVEHWAVGFLDLLGQRAALRKMDFLPSE